jgi:tubby-related protein 1
MAARKRSGMKTSHYLISKNNKDMNRKSENYLGKVRSNFMGTCFNIWDNGENPKKLKGR